mmetsp:Transcript_12904/g.38446  ORF Transcript_12904/g.38446 Transcript_12904/m.38446 type:complete len:200 (+) Transcript_12904:538-1137(+)
MPCFLDSSRPKKTASRSAPAASRSTADTSKSHSPSSTSQPRPTVMPLRSLGRSTTPPFSMAKATFCRAGASGTNPRMTCPSRGKMSMKCWPDCAGKSTRRMDHPPGPLCIAATTSTQPLLRSISSSAISQSSEPSMTCSVPSATSPSEPPEYAATTKTRRRTCGGNRFTLTHTISAMPSGLPAASSPEWVMERTAFKLL